MAATYTLYSDPITLEESDWQGHVGDFTHLVGHSALGLFFLYQPATSEHGILYPQRGAFRSYGAMHPREFREQVLDDPYVQSVIFEADKVAQLEQLLGPLAPSEVYIPNPMELLGGSLALGTYDKGDALVHLMIVAQLQGLGD